MPPINSGLGLVYALALLVLGSGATGVFVTKVMPQRVSKDDRIERLEVRIKAAEDGLTEERRSRRRLEDYVEDLRQHISEGKGPPPPDWPENLR